MTYQGILPQVIKQNELISEGKRFSNSVPQIPFNGITSPKIKRAGVAKRLSPSMSKEKTFVKHGKFSYMEDTADFAGEMPYSYPYNPAPFDPRQSPYYTRPQPNQPLPYPQPYSGNYPEEQYPKPYISTPEVYSQTEGRRKFDSRRQAYNSGVNTSREARRWITTANTSNNELRSNLKFLGINGRQLVGGSSD
jgi:hypothetical protein